MNDIEKLQGYVETITFHNPESGFHILKIKCTQQKDLITLTGIALNLHTGEYIEAEGQWINDQKYGRQFKADNICKIQPSTLEGITKYLSSGLIKGIGSIFAKRLVKAFGDQIFNVIENTPEKLLTLKGIGPNKIRKITQAWKEHEAIRNIMVFLQTHKIGTSRATRIYKMYKEDAIDKITQNPYRLIQDIHGIGFKVADNLAVSLGIHKTALIRARAGILHIIQTLNAEGHCAVFLDTLIQKSKVILNIPENIILDAIEAETHSTHLISDTIHEQSCLYTSHLYHAECNVAKHLHRLLTAPLKIENIDTAHALKWVEKITHLTLSDSQKNALDLAINKKCVCITGGPGVGKTTLVNSIIQIIQSKNANIVLCAPTGRAAKKLSESTHLEAKTIHRLLEFNPHTNDGGFKYNESNPLDADLIVIDEASMIDILLMQHLLNALPDKIRMLIVGDIDQLPSVGPGKVLSDIIHSNRIPTIHLTEIFRQAAESQIIINAHRINAGKIPHKIEKGMPSDFYIIHCNTPKAIYKTLNTLVTERIPQTFQADPISDIQVLTPMNKGGLGVKSLNIELQSILNPNPQNHLSKFGSTYGTGDKVIQTVNNYDKEVFNGDLGIIQSINHVDHEINITFDAHKTITYSFDELDEINLAYATSIHKSQGSEYPIVIIPIAMQHYMLLQRNLLYTAVTRGKKLVILLGEAKAIAMAIHNITQNNRLTKLAQRIDDFFSKQSAS